MDVLTIKFIITDCQRLDEPQDVCNFVIRILIVIIYIDSEVVKTFEKALRLERLRTRRSFGG